MAAQIHKSLTRTLLTVCLILSACGSSGVQQSVFDMETSADQFPIAADLCSVPVVLTNIDVQPSTLVLMQILKTGVDSATEETDTLETAALSALFSAVILFTGVRTSATIDVDVTNFPADSQITVTLIATAIRTNGSSQIYQSTVSCIR